MPGSSSIFWLISHYAGIPGSSNMLEYSASKLDQQEGGTMSGPTSPALAHMRASIAATWLVGYNNTKQALQPLCMSRLSYFMLHNSTLMTGEVGSTCRVTAPWCSTHSTDTVQACPLLTGFVALSHSIPNTTL